MNKWEKRGERAAKSGKWQNAFYAWKDTRGKPAVRVGGVMRIDPNTERYRTARDSFIEGFRSSKRNPLPIGKLVTVRAKRLRNGRIELRGMR